MQEKRIIGIDPGSSICGVVVMDDNQIRAAFQCSPAILLGKVTEFSIHPNLTIIIEDIRPYSLQLTPHVIDTCKVIGVLEFVLKNHCGFDVKLMPRSSVKKWIFDNFQELSVEEIRKKNSKKMYESCCLKTREIISTNTDGKTARKENFTQIDDRIVIKAMKVFFGFPEPKKGYGYPFGLKEHSWQALALACTFLAEISQIQK